LLKVILSQEALALRERYWVGHHALDVPQFSVRQSQQAVLNAYCDLAYDMNVRIGEKQIIVLVYRTRQGVLHRQQTTLDLPCSDQPNELVKIVARHWDSSVVAIKSVDSHLTVCTEFTLDQAYTL
jgi:hypothetical protein